MPTINWNSYFARYTSPNFPLPIVFPKLKSLNFTSLISEKVDFARDSYNDFFLLSVSVSYITQHHLQFSQKGYGTVVSLIDTSA